MAKKHSIYFSDFAAMADLSCKAAAYLQTTLKNFKPETLQKCREEMHAIEHEEDEVKHAMMKRLAKEFVTPIDREDIMQLANVLDDVTDKIEDILIRMYMYNIASMRPEALAFADVIQRSCIAIQEAMQEFPNFHKPDNLKQKIININSMEEEGDDIYINAVRALYEGGGDMLEIVSWGELFDKFEDCCDACEHVADAMDYVLMKNS